jgi:hypothetical protein
MCRLARALEGKSRGSRCGTRFPIRPGRSSRARYQWWRSSGAYEAEWSCPHPHRRSDSERKARGERPSARGFAIQAGLVGVSGFDGESTALGARSPADSRHGEEPLKAQHAVQRRRRQPGRRLEAAPELALGDEQRGGHRRDGGASARRQASDASATTGSAAAPSASRSVTVRSSSPPPRSTGSSRPRAAGPASRSERAATPA